MSTLIAGVGNVFLGDDGFGVEVVGRLRRGPLPPEVKVADFGIRGLHLAYELLDGGYETTILVDATARGGEPGTVYLLEPDLANFDAAGEGAPRHDAREALGAHGITPDAVFRLLALLGGRPSSRVLVVGCEPATVDEGIGLSAPVEQGVEEAVRLILDLLPTAQGRG